jgi:hypothetical protein
LLTTALACAPVAAGCAHDLPGWKLAATDHFQIYTDRPRRIFEPLIEHLEEVHAGLSSSFFEGDTPPPMQVFLFGSTEFKELVGDNVAGRFLTFETGQPGILVMPERWETEYLNRTAAHELTHAFVNANHPDTPLWFHEGFAEYCESIKVEQDKVWFGSKMEVDAGAAFGQLVPVADLFAVRDSGFHGSWETRYYTTSWAMVHYLLHGEKKSLRPRFDQFRSALLTGPVAERTTRAWQQVFPELPVADLDGHLRDHLTATFALPRSNLVGFKLSRPPVPELRLTPADPTFVDRVRAVLQASGVRRDGRRRRRKFRPRGQTPALAAATRPRSSRW